MAETQIRIGGFGGQGVILGGMVIGKAAAIYAGLNSTLIQAFGPEARGSACSAEVIVSDQPVAYPYVRELDMLVVLSQDAYNRFLPGLKPGGLLITEADLVNTVPPPPTDRVFKVQATRIAEELGRKMVLNIVAVGFFGAGERPNATGGIRESCRGLGAQRYRKPQPQGLCQRLRGRASGGRRSGVTRLFPTRHHEIHTFSDSVRT
jgi:2-oxoglutarate ferredoxin oxidoreductase subunit gamma